MQILINYFNIDRIAVAEKARDTLYHVETGLRVVHH